jgi:hypothetical protein
MRRTLATLLLFAIGTMAIQQGVYVLVLRQTGHRRASREEAGSTFERRPDESGRDERDRDVLHVWIVRRGKHTANPVLRRLGEREVLYRDRLYDLVRQEQKGDTLHVWLLRDREEELALRESGHGDGSSGAVVQPPGLRSAWILYESRTSVRKEKDVPKTYAIVFGPRVPVPEDIPVPPPRG